MPRSLSRMPQPKPFPSEISAIGVGGALETMAPKSSEPQQWEGLGMHSFRRWFISAAQAGGAAKDVVRETTHRPKGDVLEDSYTRRSWETLCAAVLAVGLRPDDGADVLPISSDRRGRCWRKCWRIF